MSDEYVYIIVADKNESKVCQRILPELAVPYKTQKSINDLSYYNLSKYYPEEVNKFISKQDQDYSNWVDDELYSAECICEFGSESINIENIAKCTRILVLYSVADCIYINCTNR